MNGYLVCLSDEYSDVPLLLCATEEEARRFVFHHPPFGLACRILAEKVWDREVTMPFGYLVSRFLDGRCEKQAWVCWKDDGWELNEKSETMMKELNPFAPLTLE